MKKIIQILLIIVLLLILAFFAVIAFNPFDLRTKLIGSIINSYLENNIENYTPLETPISTSAGSASDKHPLLNEFQEEKLEEYGVNIEQLPTEITPGMEACFMEKLGKERTDELVAGDSPTAIEIFKAKECLGK